MNDKNVLKARPNGDCLFICLFYCGFLLMHGGWDRALRVHALTEYGVLGGALLRRLFYDYIDTNRDQILGIHCRYDGETVPLRDDLKTLICDGRDFETVLAGYKFQAHYGGETELMILSKLVPGLQFEVHSVGAPRGHEGRELAQQEGAWVRPNSLAPSNLSGRQGDH